ncbi:TetR/AcrR family transcriptional regulator C-terminal domain-containing protein [Paractinoplanes atraurantiacus]|uniref:TetR/AcrR family transcriptional regulator, tetracycline repressor protein n=1 Tax=Paractinoplanes atraurantiacus TaxID=1036182 RepID=A0A285FJR5_9ACTN|nr:TetR/AcrR family transcriptional regulator C-terminal domain-containing protein [Actinoplanes atraurantiacus]SNY11517.1 TetR/AcrR family transcriptional regulator, tetracycline repressor protein [Actinoplanes atraurantiacus]
MKGLSREVLIDAGLRLLNEGGLDGLTVRKLAASLDVQSPALYWHFKTKQDLLDGMASAVIQRAGMGPPRDGEAWPDWLRRRARAYRRSLLAHRDGARLITSARRAPDALHGFEEELAAMVRLGFTPALALQTIMTVADYTNGFVLQEQATVGPPGEAELAALAQLPTLMAAFESAGYRRPDESFEHGLSVLVAGTEAVLRD